MSDLATLQERFAAGLMTPGDYPVELFAGDPQLAARRFALYRGNVTASWDKALANAYPVLRQLVGDEFFRAMAREFGRAVPSAEGDLNRFGAGLAAFLADFGPVSGYPYFPDMARLEWALHRAHYAADEPLLTLASLAGMDAQGLGRLNIRFAEACVLLHSQWNIADIWLAHQPGGPSRPDDIRRPSHYMVCRPRWRAELAVLSSGEHAALEAIARSAAAGPTSLGGALEIAAGADPSFDPSISLPRWLQCGVFAGAEPHDL